MNYLMSITRSKLCYLLIIGGVYSSSVYGVEFNTKVLETMGFDNVDLSAFSGENDQFTGKYLADVKLNNQLLYYNHPIDLYTKEGASHICFTEELLKSLPLSREIRSGAMKNPIHTTDAGVCYGLMQYDPAIVAEYHDDKQQMILRMPHAYVVEFDPYWVPPDQRDYGISGLILDYNLLQTFSRVKEGVRGYRSSSNFTSYGTMGANIGHFRLRSDYQYDSDHKEHKFERTQTYAFTDIGSLNAQLYAGELNTRSNIFDTVRFKGVSLFTNESMMPSFLQGYAPQITGTASTDAIVTVRQSGNIIRQVQVPPGPFAIANIPSYISGIVDVTVEESNGTTSEFQMEITSVPYLTRKGAIRYNINIGKFAPQDSRRDINTKLISADASYGLTNTISIIGGVNYTSNNEYFSYDFGLGLNLGFLGGLSLNVTHSENKAIPGQKLTGQSYHFNYAKSFSRYTTLNIIGYRFSSQNFTTLNHYVHMKVNESDPLHQEKNRFSVSMSQSIPDWNIGFSASATRSTYWNQESESYYNLSAYTSIRKGILENTSLSLNLTHNKRTNGKKDNMIRLFVNIPIHYDDRNANISYSAGYHDTNSRIEQQATYHDYGFGGNYSVGISMSNQRDLSGAVDYALNASYNTNLSYGNFNGSANISSDQSFMNAGFNGSLTLTQYGLATHSATYGDGTRVIIDTGVSGVKVQGYDISSNIFGLAGISNVPDYFKSTYQINTDDLPSNVEIPDNVFHVAPTQGAIAYRTTNAISGEKHLAILTLPDGSHPPFGAYVYRENSEDIEIAIVADKGLTYLTGLNHKSSYIVKWGADQTCRLKFKELYTEEMNKISCNPI